MIDVTIIPIGISTDGNVHVYMCHILLHDIDYFSYVLSIDEEFVEKIAKV